MNILTAYYRMTYFALYEYLHEVIKYVGEPKLILSNAMGYYGKISCRNNQYRIYLSKHNLEPLEGFMTKEDELEIIDTICHEFAHMIYSGHGKDHKELTECFVNIANYEIFKIKHKDTLSEKDINIEKETKQKLKKNIMLMLN